MMSLSISNCRQRLLLSGARIIRRQLLGCNRCWYSGVGGSGEVARHHYQHPFSSWRSLSSALTVTTRSFSIQQQELDDDEGAKKSQSKWETDLENKTTATKAISSRRLYRYLHLESFSKEEFQERFEEIARSSRDSPVATTHNNSEAGDTSSSTSSSPPSPQLEVQHQSIEITKENFESYLTNFFQQVEMQNSENFQSKYNEQDTKSIRQAYAAMEAQRCWDYFLTVSSTEKNKMELIRGGGSISKDDFVSIVTKSASTIDIQKILPLTTSMLLVGSSVGVVTPAMPFVVQNLGLTAGEYGLVVSAFALAKMTGNIPSAVLVERYGRKPYLVYTMGLVAIGVGGIGLASSFEHLYLCRLFTGLGVSCLSTAVTMTVTDLSTPLNRASTFAPIMSAFAAGTALGPALGGFLVDGIGINPTFYLVGASYIGVAAINNVLLDETKPSANIELPWQQTDDQSMKDSQQVSMKQSFEDALGQWIPLLSIPQIRNVCAINGFYWIALAGSQMTLLPLILTDPNGLAMTATDVGKVYMGMSCVQVLGNPIFAKAVDTVGKVPGIVTGCIMISTAMATLPLCDNMYQMSGALAIWAAGSSLLSTSPISFISDKVADEKRAQAIALLRTSGDVGFLIGASTMGQLADFTGSLDMAMQSSSGILLTATGWFTVRHMMTRKVKKIE